MHGVKETAHVLGVNPRTVLRMCESGRIAHAAKIGGRWRINIAAEWPQLVDRKEGPPAQVMADGRTAEEDRG